MNPARRLVRKVQRHYITRKIVAQPRQGLRWALSWNVDDDAHRRRPACLVNSFPKSGTHLLLQLVEGAGLFKSYGTILSSMNNSAFYRRLPASTVLRQLARSLPGEVLAGHLHHDPEYVDLLTRRRTRALFIYRDLRDVAVSDAHYLSTMNRVHRLHRYFRTLPNIEACIQTAIEGIEDPAWEYPDIGTRFRFYLGWIDEPECLALKFEDLRNGREACLRSVARTLLGEDAAPKRVDEIAGRMTASARPAESHTFRSGETGGWTRILTRRHVHAIERVAGPILERLGYE